ncbi:helix-turn-helix DNA binding domain protein [Streptomyces phage Hiyaa]|jgi:transposase-like protein|uniref:Helix-turn-helix DNA binding domain protein n=1 Tax=Streptomyces phage Hiyaa TaxID=2499072 RepID=A0A3S9U8J0_9CAUD|nr:helix-turn-helix DNA binding domain protein [Streptomyces phage Hiyaa]AZS06641.1 helix-turn-helix DNA binding domain protein [Streptomyces phage Hiyaa]
MGSDPNGRAPNRLPPELRAQVVEDLRSGKYGRNEIARRNNVGQSTVTYIANQEDLSAHKKTDITEEATRAMAANNRQRREVLKEQMYGDIQRLRVRAWSSWSREVVTKEGIETLTAELPPLPEVLAAYKAIQINLDGIFKLDALDAAQGESAQDAKDFLMELREQMGKVRDEFEAKHGVAFDSEEARTIIQGELADDSGGEGA